MASTPRLEGSHSGTETVVGFFNNGEDARHALDELVDEGFASSQIGAAFHSSYGSEHVGEAGVTFADKTPLIDPDTTGLGSGASGPASGTTAVTPAGLSTGSGTSTTAAGRPGPIPGSELPGRAETSTDGPAPLNASPVSARSGVTPPPDAVIPTTSAQPSAGAGVARDFDRAGSSVHTHEHQGSWWDKLKHIFASDESHGTNRTITDTAAKEARNFGTGEGHLNVSSPRTQTTATNQRGSGYSSATFERSFANFGIPGEHARYLARQLGSGGAVVTVRAGSRLAEAEQILNRNNGSIRFESGAAGSLTDWVDQDEASRVEVFGEMERTHRSEPSSVAGSQIDQGSRSRKAS
jgi:hypothetical protein